MPDSPNFYVMMLRLKVFPLNFLQIVEIFPSVLPSAFSILLDFFALLYHNMTIESLFKEFSYWGSERRIKMNVEEILAKADHTLLKPEAGWEQIREIIDDGIRYKTASVCIPPSFIGRAKSYLRSQQSELKLCTVIGFPNGYSTTAVKCFEAQEAIREGADEIDMVINIGWLKDKQYDLVAGEIRELRKVCSGKVLKVIIETCLLTDEEIIRMCKLVADEKADFIKTSTGFSTEGATLRVVTLMKQHVPDTLKIKAAGGISTLEDAEAFLSAGADRLGTSRIVKLIKETMDT